MKPPPLTWISETDPPQAFPDVNTACTEPDGLLAAGGDLSEQRLLYAYRHGIFPWYEDGQPILWWSPNPRCIIRPNQFHVSRRLRRDLRKSQFEVSFNQAFSDVITACAGERAGQQGTWITADMALAYQNLHTSGWAHSVEVWSDGELCGGIYGLAIGKVFFGESMFSRQSNASKLAMLVLCAELDKAGFVVLDCQVESPHLMSLGAELLGREKFADLLCIACKSQSRFGPLPAERLKIEEYIH